jgi:hypothetical protein
MRAAKILSATLLLLVSLTATAQDYNPFKSIGKKGKILTLSKGKYVEFFDYDTIQRIGTVLINIRTKKIVKLLNAEEVYKKASNNSSSSRWYSPDPLAAKYSQWSPYVFVNDNPIRYNDPDGRELVDPNGKHVSVRFNKNGTLSFKNATADIKRIANALNLTDAGRAQLRTVLSSDVKVKMNISQETKIETKADGVHRTYGETQQGNPNSPPTYGQYVRQDGTMGIKEASVTIYEGTINKGIQEGSGLKHEGLTMEQAIGAVAGHEIVHATDKIEINKDLQETQGKPRTDNREIKPEKVENKIIEQSKKINE